MSEHPDDQLGFEDDLDHDPSEEDMGYSDHEPTEDEMGFDDNSLGLSDDQYEPSDDEIDHPIDNFDNSNYSSPDYEPTAEDVISIDDPSVYEIASITPGYSDEIDTSEFFTSTKSIPLETIKKLSKSRFHQSNIDMITQSLPLINSMTDNEIFDTMFVALGNATIPYQTKLSQYSLTQKFTTYLMNENCSFSPETKKLRFKENLFKNFAQIKKPTNEIKYFKNTIKFKSVLDQSSLFECLSCCGEWALPRSQLNKKTSISLKKLFAFELLTSELNERENIKNSLSETINKYEKSIMNIYETISQINSVNQSTSVEDELNLKIGFIHIALEQDGYEHLFISNNFKAGIAGIDEPIDILKKQALQKHSKKTFTKIETENNISSIFTGLDQPGINIKSFTTDDYEIYIKNRKSLLSQSSPHDKEAF